MIVLTTGVLPAAASPLAGSEWAPDGEPRRYVAFKADGKVRGNAGCNQFFGNFTTAGDAISIGPFGTTRKHCGKVIMKAERDFLAALSSARRYSFKHLRLTLVSDGGGVLLRLKRRDWD